MKNGCSKPLEIERCWVRRTPFFVSGKTALYFLMTIMGTYFLVFPGNFLIYCSMLPPFKEALSKICAFFCFWNWRNRQLDSGSIEENMPETIATGTTILPTVGNGNGRGTGNRRTTVLISREPVSGEPPKAARVFRLFSKRNLSHNKRSRKFPEDDYVEVPAILSHNGNNGIGTNGTLLSTTNNDSDLVVQVTIEAAGKSEQAAKDEITT